MSSKPYVLPTVLTGQKCPIRIRRKFLTFLSTKSIELSRKGSENAQYFFLPLTYKNNS